jgi:hypothetical protein
MDQEQARRECERLRREHPERATHTWIPREVDGRWEVVRAPLPRGIRRDPLKATVEAKPQPRDAEDPRPAPFRNIPPFAAG